MGAHDKWRAGLRPTPGIRPPALRRTERQRHLLEALALGPLSAAQAAALLGCSSTAARNDLRELAAARVVAACSVQGVETACVQFGLTGNAQCLARFLARLGETPAQPMAPAAQPARGRYIHTIFNDASDMPAVDEQPARRDPLVAALFGVGCAEQVRSL